MGKTGTVTPYALSASWRDRAGELEPYSPAAATAYRAAADELEEALRAAADELLTLAEAAEESGYSKRRLRELLADGAIPQAGRKHAPRIRRADLPVRPGAATSSSSAHEGYDLDRDADSLVASI